MFEQIEQGYYDFLYFSLGIAMYFLQKKDFLIIKRYVKMLFEVSFKKENLIYWLDNSDRTVIPKPNIGLAHGMSSIIIFLSKVYKLGIEKVKVSVMLNSAVNYILSQEIKSKTMNQNLFPTMSLADEELQSRLGWCYGDLCIGLALWQAGDILSNPSWKNKALRLFYNSNSRIKLKENFVFDAGFCHGTAGIAHLYKRMYLNTLDKSFLMSNIFWVKETIKKGRYEDSDSKYLTWSYSGYCPTDCSLLEGISGIALSLLSSITPAEYSDWDNLLLMH